MNESIKTIRRDILNDVSLKKKWFLKNII
jgi:hypothetical protein